MVSGIKVLGSLILTNIMNYTLFNVNSLLNFAEQTGSGAVIVVWLFLTIRGFLDIIKGLFFVPQLIQVQLGKESNSNVTLNAGLPQASYPCGNFSDTSQFKF